MTYPRTGTEAGSSDERLEKRLVPLPSRKRRHETDAHDIGTSRRHLRERIEIYSRPRRRKAPEVDGVPDRIHRRRVAAHLRWRPVPRSWSWR